MPPKRKLKHVPPIAFVATPNSSNGSPSPRGQGQQSNPLLVSVLTPSTAHSGVNTIAQSSVDPTAIAETPDKRLLMVCI